MTTEPFDPETAPTQDPTGLPDPDDPTDDPTSDPIAPTDPEQTEPADTDSGVV